MKKVLFFITSIVVTLSSCVTILQSLVTHDNIIVDNRIVGKWYHPELKNIFVAQIVNSKFNKDLRTEKSKDHKGLSAKDSAFYAKHYVISYQENMLEYTWIAALVKINHQYFLNIIPEGCKNSNGKEVYDLGQTTSSIARLTWKSENMLTLDFLNGGHIKEIILNGKAHIKYEYDALFDTFLITASSPELEQFLGKYGNNESLYKGGNTINLTRKL
jgi:hypothetical protein